MNIIAASNWVSETGQVIVAETTYIAIDLGAESGRVMLATLAGTPLKLSLTEVHRFPNTPVAMAGGLRWNIQQLWSEISTGVAKAAASATGVVSGISTDSWGVDYVLIGSGSPMLAPPFIYRDPRHTPHYERMMKGVGREFIYAQTGIQFMPINTLYQLLSEPPALLGIADGFLPIADYVNWLLCGRPEQLSCEISMASTTQIFDVGRRQWSDALIERAGLPRDVFPNVVDSGTELGQCEVVPDAKVIATCSHDTGCAVAAVPAEGDNDDWAYISSGTWSLAGMELAAPVVTEQAREFGFTNELGAAGTTRLLKNISGLYILQQCRNVWSAAGQQFSYAELASLAETSPPARSLIRPDSSIFATPGDMPARIAEFCKKTGQPVPENIGQVVRCIYESLALLYRQTLLELQQLTGRVVRRLHIVGGGSRSSLLNQLSADACGLTVIAGPVEATSIGNALIQASALGHIKFSEIRQIVRQSVSPDVFQPAHNDVMHAAFERFKKLPMV